MKGSNTRGTCGTYREERNLYRFLWRSLKERDHWEDIGVDGVVMLKRVLQKWDDRSWAGFMWLRLGTKVGSYEYGNEYSGCIKFWKLFGWFLHW
jgi:hypothetical protein